MSLCLRGCQPYRSISIKVQWFPRTLVFWIWDLLRCLRWGCWGKGAKQKNLLHRWTSKTLLCVWAARREEEWGCSFSSISGESNSWERRLVQLLLWGEGEGHIAGSNRNLGENYKENYWVPQVLWVILYSAWQLVKGRVSCRGDWCLWRRFTCLFSEKICHQFWDTPEECKY